MEGIECSKCREVKTKDKYYSCTKYSSGIRQPCKDCAKATDKISRDRYTKNNKESPSEKTCGTCGKLKDSSCFNKRSDTPTGLRSDCKDCQSVKRHEHYEDNKESVIERTTNYRLEHLEDYNRRKRVRYWKDPELSRSRDATYRENNRDNVNEYSRNWCKLNPDKRKSYSDKYFSKESNRVKRKESRRLWAANNKDLVCYYASLRRSRVLSATPSWADHDVIKSFYKESQYFGESVDHIIPLVHPLVCGLHVEFNLQMLPLLDNIRKNNRFEVCEHDLPLWFEVNL